MALLFFVFLCSIIIVTIGRGKVNGTINTKPQLDKEMTLVFKGLMIVFVLVGHFCNFVLKKHMSLWVVDNFSSFGVYAVSMFLFMSGYGLMYSFEKKGSDYLNGFGGIRLTKVMIPLMVATIFFLPVNFVVQHQTWLEIGSAFIHGVPPLRFSWFAYMIVVAYLIFYLCARWFGYGMKLVIGVAVGLLLYAIVLYGLGWKEHWYASSLSVPLGMLICYYRDIITKSFQERYVWCVVLTIAAMLLTYASGIIGLSYWTTSITITLCFYLYIYFWKFTNTGIIRFLGKYSYEIYLCHGVFITLCANCFGKVAAWKLLLLVFASVILLFMISVVLQWFCSKIAKVKSV